MTVGLETFAKVRALHDRTDSQGEKAAAMLKMQTLARKAGMSVEQAMSTLDTPAPKPSSFFDDLFNTPEFRASQAERERDRLARCAVLLEEYGSEDAVFADTALEAALRQACAGLPAWDDFTPRHLMPPTVAEAVTAAWPMPCTVAEAWVEYESAERRADNRCSFDRYYSPEAFMQARCYLLEEILDTEPSRGFEDLQARVAWLEHLNGRGFSRSQEEQTVVLGSLRQDVERLFVQTGRSVENDRLKSEPMSSVQSGHLRRTNAEKRRDVLALLNAENACIAPLTDREIARRAGVSPQTVGNIRRHGYEVG